MDGAATRRRLGATLSHLQPKDASALTTALGAAVGLGLGWWGRQRFGGSGGGVTDSAGRGDGGPQERTAENLNSLADLAGGVAVITGGASGIGFALALKAVESGIHVALADIEPSALEKAEAELADAAAASGVTVYGHVTDCSVDDSVAGLAAAVAQQFPGKPISLLAANAGVGGGGPVMNSPAKEWEWVMGVNLFGVASTIRHFVPGMVEQGKPGAIVVSGQPLSCHAAGAVLRCCAGCACTQLTRSWLAAVHRQPPA